MAKSKSRSRWLGRSSLLSVADRGYESQEGNVEERIWRVIHPDNSNA